MIMRKRVRGVVGVVAMASAVALAVSGCTRGGDDTTTEEGGEAAASPGITDTSLTFGITSPLTGMVRAAPVVPDEVFQDRLRFPLLEWEARHAHGQPRPGHGRRACDGIAQVLRT